MTLKLGFLCRNIKLDPFNALQAKTEAQKLSFAPIVFHTARTLRWVFLKALDGANS